MRAWQIKFSNTPHFASFSDIFVCFLPLLVGFYNIFLFFFFHFAFFSAIPLPYFPIGTTVWQSSLAR